VIFPGLSVFRSAVRLSCAGVHWHRIAAVSPSSCLTSRAHTPVKSRFGNSAERLFRIMWATVSRNPFLPAVNMKRPPSLDATRLKRQFAPAMAAICLALSALWGYETSCLDFGKGRWPLPTTEQRRQSGSVEEYPMSPAKRARRGGAGLG